MNPSTALVGLIVAVALAPAAAAQTVDLGGEARVRVEGFDRPDFGLSGPDYVSFAHRLLIQADIRAAPSGARVFAQLSWADQDGRRPGPRPFDDGGVDLAQAYVDLPAQTRAGRLTLRAGRQELTFAGNRLVGLRDGVTLRRAFDGGRLTLDMDGVVVTGFLARPVVIGPDDFDDVVDRGDRFGGVTIDFAGDAPGRATQMFWFSRTRRASTYFGASGRDRRETVGLRRTSAGAGWDASVQGAVQIGATGSRRAFAWGGAVDVGRTVGTTRWGLQLGVASGDDDPTDDSVGTFDPLYPNLGVFSSAPLYFPANQINIGVSARRPVGRAVVSVGAVLLGRHSLDDAVYANPGRPLIAPGGGGRASAVLVEASLAAPLTPEVDLSLSLVRAEAMDAVTAAGGRDATFAQFQLTRRF